MKKMATSSVFVSGMNGLGIETAKSVALAGIKNLALHDTVNASWVCEGENKNRIFSFRKLAFS